MDESLDNLRFAVIEYSSKSGDIWRHTPSRPNYLADPAREMDPTSFGCYVSALQGEHVPIKKLIQTGSPLAVLWRRIYKRLTGHWPRTYSLNYLEKFNVVMIVHQYSNGHEVTAFTKRLKRTYPHIFILGVPTQPYGLLKRYWQKDPTWLKDFQEFMNTCNIFLTIVEETKPWWEKLTNTPVVYLPQPYPVEYASQFFVPHVQKEKVLFVAGVTDRPNIKLGQRVAKALQQKFPEYIIHVTEVPGLTLDVSELAGARYEVIPFREWPEHLEYLGKTILVINTDFTFTRGRVQVDCAAVGTLSLGSNSDGQKDLFPELAATPETTLEKLVSQGRRLLQDVPLYNRITTEARLSLQKFTYKESAQRIIDMYQRKI
jgi:hypothetical protein